MLTKNVFSIYFLKLCDIKIIVNLTIIFLFLGPLLPKYYYVREEDIEEEKANPGSCRRVPSGDKDNPEPFLWGQSLYIISQLLGI